MQSIETSENEFGIQIHISERVSVWYEHGREPRVLTSKRGIDGDGSGGAFLDNVLAAMRLADQTR